MGKRESKKRAGDYARSAHVRRARVGQGVRSEELVGAPIGRIRHC